MRLGVVFGVLGAGIVAAGAVFGIARLWTPVSVRPDAQALARLQLAPLAVRVRSVRVTADGNHLPVALRGDRLWPLAKVAPGERIEIRVVVEHAGWTGGGTKVTKTKLVAPEVKVASTLMHPRKDAPVFVRFAAPVQTAVIAKKNVTAPNGAAVIPVGVRASGANATGTVLVRAAARSWESLSQPVEVSWFPAGTTPQVIVKPTPGSEVKPATPIVLTLSEPIAVLFGKELPQVDPKVPGSWQAVSANKLVFFPRGSGYALGSKLTVSLPRALAVPGSAAAQVLHYAVPGGSTLRLQQLLAQLGYLPLDWHADGDDVPRTLLAQTSAALEPPAGHFTWRFDAPAELRALWAPGEYNTMTQAALMAFQHDRGISVDGVAGPAVWHAVLNAVVQGKVNTFGYSYVLVHRSVPQRLYLWHDGKLVLTTLVNTGVPGAPTPYGTHAVFEHIPSGTMSGTNPDGSTYHDPGIPWISYFYGGEAIHGFNRGSYGFPQSVGCVETPISVAGKIWPYTPIGTLVTITP